MELINDFTVNAPIDTAYATLTDVERIAPCLPGAQLTEIEGEAYRGLKAEGRDTGGKGNASALITAQLEEIQPDTTKVTVTTDLTITGKVAQFGRGALADVSEKLLRQFVTNLETTVLADGGSDGPGGAAPATKPTTGGLAEGDPEVPPGNGAGRAPSQAGARRIESAPVEPIDLIETAGAPLIKRLLPLIGGAVLLLVVWRLLRRRGG